RSRATGTRCGRRSQQCLERLPGGSSDGTRAYGSDRYQLWARRWCCTFGILLADVSTAWVVRIMSAVSDALCGEKQKRRPAKKCAAMASIQLRVSLCRSLLLP